MTSLEMRGDVTASWVYDAENPAYMFTELRVGYRSPKRGQGVLFRGDSTPHQLCLTTTCWLLPRLP